jgi:hypothetical protein
MSAHGLPDSVGDVHGARPVTLGLEVERVAGDRYQDRALDAVRRLEVAVRV